MALFDPAAIKALEEKPSILSVLLYADGLHNTLHKHISNAIGNLDVMTGKHLGLIYVDTAYDTHESYEIDPGSIPPNINNALAEWARPLSHVSSNKTNFRATKHIEHTVAVAKHFKIENPLQLPCIVFFERFNADEAYVFPLNGLTPDHITTFILQAANNANIIWTEYLQDGTTTVTPDLRRHTFNAFRAFLNRKHYGRQALRLSSYGSISAFLFDIGKRLIFP